MSKRCMISWNIESRLRRIRICLMHWLFLNSSLKDGINPGVIFEIKESRFWNEIWMCIFTKEITELFHCKLGFFLFIGVNKVFAISLCFFSNLVYILLEKRLEGFDNLIIGFIWQFKVAMKICLSKFRNVRRDVMRFPRQHLLVFCLLLFWTVVC